MAALHGLIHKDNKDRGKHSTIAHKSITAELQTWNGRIIVELKKDDTYEIRMSTHSSEGNFQVLVASGSVNMKHITLAELIEDSEPFRV